MKGSFRVIAIKFSGESHTRISHPQQERVEEEDLGSLNKSNSTWCSQTLNINLPYLTSILQPAVAKKGLPRKIWMQASLAISRVTKSIDI